MRILVYVEGRSDSAACEELFRPLISTGQERGIGIRFLPLSGKAQVLSQSPRKAAGHLLDNPEDYVLALPDLYPMAPYDGSADAHRSFEELDRVLRRRFIVEADRVGLAPALRDRFRVHCLKHDLEALLLASPTALRDRLRTSDALEGQWRRPVEDQNDMEPPKRIIEGLFRRYFRKRNYVDTLDAPWILARSSLEETARACPQRFAPFVRELQGLVGAPPR